MAAERKLKAEIDRTLKKIIEGQELFEDLWNQVHDCENSNQREKLEGELKKEIKKLQRLREQIKAWIAGADIKDKQPLMDARRSIERDMERFKACEKESKIKGINRVYNDPKEKAKEDARDWINATVDTLTTKIEEHEYEIEELQSALKKKQKPPPRMAELEEIVGQYKEHVDHMEKVLRCIDNEAIQPDELEELKADFEMYLSPDEDNYGSYSIDDMYASFIDRMEAVDHAAPATAVAAHVKHAPKGKEKEEADREREREKERERERAAAAAAKAQLIAQGNTSLKLDEEESSRKGAAAGAAPVAGKPSPPGLVAPTPGTGAVGQAPATPTSRTTPTALSIADGAVAGGPTTPSARNMPPGAGPPPPVSPRTSLDSGMAVLRPAGMPPAPGFPAPSTTAAAAAVPAAARGQAQQQSNWLFATSGQNGQQEGLLGSSTANHLVATPSQHQSLGGGSTQAASMAMSKLQQGSPAQPQPAPPPRAGALGSYGSLASAEQQLLGGRLGEAGSLLSEALSEGADRRSAAERDHFDGRLTPSVPPPEVLNLPQVVPPFTLQAAKQILEACHQRAMPQLSDTEWKNYKPLHPASVPASFPRQQHEVVDNPALFRRLDPECLFFSFYFQPDSYQQYLAAHELKRQSWRFHKHHNAWFQRFTEPTITSDEYEQGAYVYFDYNIVHDDMQTGWCYRRKENFTFRYDALEDELRVQQL